MRLLSHKLHYRRRIGCITATQKLSSVPRPYSKPSISQTTWLDMMDTILSRLKESKLPTLLWPPSTLLMPLFIISGLEVFRLEKRYARRGHKDAYKGNACYNDGEYTYPTYQVGQIQRKLGCGASVGRGHTGGTESRHGNGLSRQ